MDLLAQHNAWQDSLVNKLKEQLAILKIKTKKDLYRYDVLLELNDNLPFKYMLQDKVNKDWNACAKAVCVIHQLLAPEDRSRRVNDYWNLVERGKKLFIIDELRAEGYTIIEPSS